MIFSVQLCIPIIISVEVFLESAITMLYTVCAFVSSLSMIEELYLLVLMNKQLSMLIVM